MVPGTPPQMACEQPRLWLTLLSTSEASLAICSQYLAKKTQITQMLFSSWAPKLQLKFRHAQKVKSYFPLDRYLLLSLLLGPVILFYFFPFFFCWASYTRLYFTNFSGKSFWYKGFGSTQAVRDVTRISSLRVNTTRRWGIRQLHSRDFFWIYFSSVFLWK